MATFITLTSAGNDLRVRFAVAHIVRYEPSSDGSDIITTEPLENGQLGAYSVTETPEQIDAMLGVTEDSIVTARLVSLVDDILTSPAALNRPWEWDEREAWISKAQKAVRAARGE